jgi:beta-lactamase class A
LNKYNLRIAGLFLFALVSGILLGWLFRSVWADSQGAASAEEEVHEGQREFINPLLECGDAGAVIGRLKSRFEDIVQKKVDEIIKSGKAEHISVYYRDLNSGPSFGIEEKEFFSPASLLKVPILIGWLKEAEKNPAILEKKIKYDGENYNANKNETIHGAAEVEYGKTYTAEELLNLMIVYSDNNAVLLLGNSGWSFSGKIYDALRLPKPDFSGGDYQLTVKDYSSFFRILYNASYLNQDMSNKALELLASVDFRRGLSAGVPENIVVAHKFGERTAPEGKQLHDCGIVYYPNRPYLLCVMTKGADFDTLVSVVSGVSRLVFDEVAREQTLQ